MCLMVGCVSTGSVERGSDGGVVLFFTTVLRAKSVEKSSSGGSVGKGNGMRGETPGSNRRLYNMMGQDRKGR